MLLTITKVESGQEQLLPLTRTKEAGHVHVPFEDVTKGTEHVEHTLFAWHWVQN